MPNKYQKDQVVYHFSQFASGVGTISEVNKDGDLYRVDLKEGGFTDAWEDEIGTHILFHVQDNPTLVVKADDPLVEEYLKNSDYTVLAAEDETTCNFMKTRVDALNQTQKTEDQSTKTE